MSSELSYEKLELIYNTMEQIYNKEIKGAYGLKNLENKISEYLPQGAGSFLRL